MNRIQIASTAQKPSAVASVIGISPSLNSSVSKPPIFTAAKAKMNSIASGSAMTSRDSHELRHIVAARQARSGWPR